jgi:hypothetical protein
MPLAGFEPTTPVFKPVKTFHAFDRAATVTCCTQIIKRLLYTGTQCAIYRLHVYTLLGY